MQLARLQSHTSLDVYSKHVVKQMPMTMPDRPGASLAPLPLVVKT